MTEIESKDQLKLQKKTIKVVEKIQNPEKKLTKKDREHWNNFFTECYAEAIEKILPFIEKFKDIPDLEIEFRLGHLDLDKQKFSANISEEFYNKIQNNLNNGEIWSSKNVINTEDYFSKGLRKSVDLLTKKETIIKKEKLCIIDFVFQNTPFDIRVSFSREIVKKSFKDEFIKYKRTKKRHSYIYKDWNYDLTTVVSEDNSIVTKTYEVELEANKPIKEITDKMDAYYFLHSSLMKIKDLACMCENEEGKFKLELSRIKDYSGSDKSED